jgi:type IV fimbrial biogenesis protein FimT
MHSQRGFTLTEILISVALIGILSATTLPSFSGFLNRQKLNVTSNNIYTAMQYAKAAAIQQNGRMTVLFNKNTGHWCVFSRNVEPDSTTCSFTSNTLENGVIRKYIEPLTSDMAIATTPSTATQITFDSLGRLAPNPDLSASLTAIAVTMPKDNKRANTIQLANGLVRMCDATKTVGDPQAC